MCDMTCAFLVGVPMSNDRLNCADPAQLVSEIVRLRGEVARLEARIEELDRLAHHDALVPLPNRRGFVRQLEGLIARLDRYGEPSAMMFVDLDGLKKINDSLGHGAGDAALCHVAERLVGGIRQSDCVARLGGDEFGILLVRTEAAAAAETAVRLCELVSNQSFVHQGSIQPLSVAIGVTTLARGDTPEAVIARADRAMYAVKAAA